MDDDQQNQAGLPSAEDLDTAAHEAEVKAINDPRLTEDDKLLGEAIAEFQGAVQEAKSEVRKIVVDFAEWVNSAKAAQADAIERLIAAATANSPLATVAVEVAPAPPAQETVPEDRDARAMKIMQDKGYAETAARHFVKQFGAERIITENS